MSRYLILILLNTPLILIALTSNLVDYKTGKRPKKKFVISMAFWVFVFASLISTKFAYDFLFSNSLTTTEPLSLFDVIQITGIIIVLFIANRTRLKIEALERRVQDLHQELSIQVSKDLNHK